MFPRWIQNHSPNKSCTNSQSFSWFSRTFWWFCRTEQKLRRMFSKLQGKEFQKCPLKLFERPVVSSQTSRHFVWTSSDYKKTCEICENCSQNLYFQTLWESHKSQQLFLSSDFGVKWTGANCENNLSTDIWFNLPNSIWTSAYIIGLLRILLSWIVCWVECFSFSWSRVVLRRESREKKWPTIISWYNGGFPQKMTFSGKKSREHLEHSTNCTTFAASKLNSIA